MRIAITGATGSLGGALATSLRFSRRHKRTMTTPRERELLRLRQQRGRDRAKLMREDVGGIEVRFWSRVAKSEACWEWMGGTHLGYGRIVYRFQDLETHRVSWILAHGPIPDGLWVLMSVIIGDACAPIIYFSVISSRTRAIGMRKDDNPTGQPMPHGCA